MSPPDGEEAGRMEEPGPSSEAGELLLEVAKHVAEVDRCMKRLGMMPKEKLGKMGLPDNFNPVLEVQGGTCSDGGSVAASGSGSGYVAVSGLVDDGHHMNQGLEFTNLDSTTPARQKLKLGNKMVIAAQRQLPFVQASATPLRSSAAPFDSAPRLKARFLKTQMCRHYLSGCRNGDLCPFAHGPGELRERPALYKTVICNFWLQGTCNLDASECNFAHGHLDLRRVDGNAKVPKQPGPCGKYAAPMRAQGDRSEKDIVSQDELQTGHPRGTASMPPWPDQLLTGPAPQQLPLPFQMQTSQHPATSGPAAPGPYGSLIQHADDDTQQPPSAMGGRFSSGQSYSSWQMSRDLLEKGGNDYFVDAATFGDFSLQRGEQGKGIKQVGVVAPSPTTVLAMCRLTPSLNGITSWNAGSSGAAPSNASNQGLEVTGHLTF